MAGWGDSIMNQEGKSMFDSDNASPVHGELAVLPPGARDDHIMSLCDKAISDLQEARTIEDVMAIAGIAAAFASYTRKLKAAVAAQNHAQTVVLLAEARIGAELKAAQNRGELAKAGNPPSGNQYQSDVRTSDVAPPPTLAEIGITRQRAAEYKKLAEVGEETIREAATAATVAGERLTREEVFNHRAQGTGENEWYTPAEHIDAAYDVMGCIDLDPASSEVANRTVLASKIFTLEDDGLAQEWHGRVWMNPPYAQPWIARFSEKLVTEFEAGRVTEAIALTHNYTDTAWFHGMAKAANAICFTRGRIGFLSPEGKRAAPTQGQAFFYFGDNVAGFAEAFGGFGLTMVRHV